MSDFTFANLDLSGAKVSSGGKFLTEGRHLVKIKNATWEKSHAGGVYIDVSFEATNGSGGTNGYYNLRVPSSKKSEEIGQDQFLSLLYYAGHPTPTKPSDINSLKGLTVGVYVAGDKKDEGTPNERVYHKVKSAFDPFDIDPVNFVKKPDFVPQPRAQNPLLSTSGTVVNF